ncbi:hypothetical protein SLS62_006902 [Diatrype stigma]|uniref:SET domain-containing protein n=1 Tax=Diatrype stigma TaxID=117547 RepID=A0AAN9UQA6_9PEZI
MDVKNVSDEPDILSFFKEIQASAERAASRKGERPQNHPHPQFLIFQFMTKLHQNQTPPEATGHMIQTSQFPLPYLPSVQPVNNLQTLMISQMILETHHRGKKAVIRALTPPDRMTAVMAIVEDEEGTAVLLQLYNQPEEVEVNKDTILQKDSIYIVKEPFFKATTDGSYSLRVDHVSDIVYLLDDDERVPRKWRKRSLGAGDDSQNLRMHGNVAVQKGNWAEAETIYSSSIRVAKTIEQSQLAHLNRSLAQLKLGRPEKALEDACKGGVSGQAPEKALFREARALYALGKFDLSLEKFQALVECHPHNKDAWAEINRVRERRREQQTGDYVFTKMYQQAEATPPLIDCATYIGPVAVRPSPGRGRGLFTTKPVKAGELLLCEKAFAYSYAGNENPISRNNTRILMNLGTKRISMGGQAYLIAQIVQKLYHNPESSALFTELHHGDYRTATLPEIDGKPIVDSFLVERIVSLNCFGAPRTSRHQFLNSAAYTKKAGHDTCGIWPLASHINHSCVTNCRRSFIGDMMIVRATQDLDTNAELVFTYNHTLVHKPYEETQEGFRNWGFTCKCTLCVDKKNTPKETVQQRISLNKSLEAALKRCNSGVQLARARKLLEKLRNTYSTRQGVPHLGLWHQYVALGATFYNQGRLPEATELFIEGLGLLGYTMEVCLPGKTSKQPALRITKWGQADVHIFRALVQLTEAYQMLSPQFSAAAKQYAELFLAIVCGEKDTFDLVYEELT